MESELDRDEYRRALGCFATGVAVVTTRDSDGTRVGLTISSFNSVSMDPPLILWSIDKGARSLPAYEQAEHFVVNVLAADQVQLSNHFARQQENRGNLWQIGKFKPPGITITEPSTLTGI